MVFTKKIKRGKKTYLIEVEGYRDKDGKVKHRYKRYLGRLGENGETIPSSKEIEVDNVYQFGFPAVITKSIEELRLREVFGTYGDEVALLVLMQLFNPSSLTKTISRVRQVDPSLRVLAGRKKIENALDFLDDKKEIIEQRLYDKLKELYDEETIFYDITSIALNGIRSNLAKIGYPEFAPQINIGLCIEAGYGFPIFHEVFPGNLSHKKTLRQVMEKLSQFRRESAVLVFDAGIATEKNIETAREVGFDIIARIPMYDPTKKIALANKTTSTRHIVQLTNSKVYVKEVVKENGRLLICFNDKIRVSIKEKRYDEVIKALEKRKKGLAIKDGIKKYLLKEGRTWKIDYEKLEEAEQYDGLYVLYSSVRDMPKEKIVKAYFDKDRIEKCFSQIKSVLEIKPVRFQTDKRIRAHIMLCHLAYLTATYIEMKLKKKELKYTFTGVKELLANVYKVHIHRGKKLIERTNPMSDDQKQVMEVFGLLS